MKLYFSSEYNGQIVGEKIRIILNNILYKMYEDFENENYGNEILGLTAIPIIVSDKFESTKERKYISRKDRESDVRLKVEYALFEKGDFNQCIDLIYSNCCDSFNYAKLKSMNQKQGDFYLFYDEFLSIFKNRFYHYASIIDKKLIEKFNSL